ncbi:hypothetical protein DENSPDRAFT_694715 [Dentipellis sp. KUC8613]|nr:hypothetical protein DENSPDRAFT_694715 [Dentipellis sp. KUC8613]
MLSHPVSLGIWVSEAFAWISIGSPRCSYPCWQPVRALRTHNWPGLGDNRNVRRLLFPCCWQCWSHPCTDLRCRAFSTEVYWRFGGFVAPVCPHRLRAVTIHARATLVTFRASPLLIDPSEGSLMPTRNDIDGGEQT